MYRDIDQILFAFALSCFVAGVMIGILAARIQQLEEENARLARISIMTLPDKTKEDQAR